LGKREGWSVIAEEYSVPIGCFEEAGTRGAKLPHPIPYQGSKRLLAPRILAVVAGMRFRRLYEPCAGSAAITLAAARRDLADSYVVGDSLRPLMEIWRCITGGAEILADAYAMIWDAGQGDRHAFYTHIRDHFNRDGDPAKLLYLLARCAKNAPRFNQQGAFNQAADRRRTGMRPAKMRRELLGAAALLADRALIRHADLAQTLADAGPGDLVYLDPPYEGTSTGKDRRYHQGMGRERLIGLLLDLNKRRIPFLLSYDGRCGARRYGEALPEAIGAVRLELHAGTSSQATLLGRSEATVESLYVSQLLGAG
jgi:DNA adenine methylase